MFSRCSTHYKTRITCNYTFSFHFLSSPLFQHIELDGSTRYDMTRKKRRECDLPCSLLSGDHFTWVFCVLGHTYVRSMVKGSFISSCTINPLPSVMKAKYMYTWKLGIVFLLSVSFLWGFSAAIISYFLWNVITLDTF